MMVKAASIPAVAYYRMSTDRQDASIPAQRKEVEAFARREGYAIIRQYIDEGITGSTAEGRPGFQRLIDDAQKRTDFAVILCWDQDRFSRFDPLEANHYWYLLRQANVQIVTVCQGPLEFSDLAGWLTASVTQHGKAQYLRDLSRNVIRGRLAKALAGKWVHSRAPYGYKMVDGDLILGGDDQVRIVRHIFQRYTESGVSLQDLAEELNRTGSTAPSGRAWTRASLHAILRREAYTGQAIQMRCQKSKFFAVRGGVIVPRHKGESTVKPKSDWLVVECPPIVSHKVWDAAQARLFEKRHRTSPKRAGGRAMLTGLMYCGHCGQRMIGNSVPRCGGKSEPKDLVYVCSTYHHRGAHGCQRNPIHEVAILDFLINNICEKVLNPENFERVRVEVGRQLEEQHQSEPVNLGKLRQSLSRLDKDIKAAVRELKRTPDDLYELAVADLRELRTRRDRVAAELEARESVVRRPAAKTASAVNGALAALQGLRDRLKDVDPAIVREALWQVCERIDVWFEHVKYPKMTRACFNRGVVSFKTCPVVGSDWPELAQLPGIGETLARRIVESREKEGRFPSPDALLRVSGVGPKKFERIKPFLLPIEPAVKLPASATPQRP